MVGLTPLATLASDAWLAFALPSLYVTVAISGTQGVAITSRRGGRGKSVCSFEHQFTQQDLIYASHLICGLGNVSNHSL